MNKSATVAGFCFCFVPRDRRKEYKTSGADDYWRKEKSEVSLDLQSIKGKKLLKDAPLYMSFDKLQVINTEQN